MFQDYDMNALIRASLHEYVLLSDIYLWPAAFGKTQNLAHMLKKVVYGRPKVMIYAGFSFQWQFLLPRAGIVLSPFDESLQTIFITISVSETFKIGVALFE